MNDPPPTFLLLSFFTTEVFCVFLETEARLWIDGVCCLVENGDGFGFFSILLLFL
jgi:hypothetical protein